MKFKSDIFDLLKLNIQNYSKSQRILAKYILDNYQTVAFSTIKQLSGLSRVSEATIIRFVKLLGFKGYPPFQREIRRRLRAELKGNERFNMASDIKEKKPDLLSALIEKEIENLKNLLATFNEKEFRRALSAIQEANPLVVIGARGTAPLSYRLWFGLTKLGIKTIRITSINTETFDLINSLNTKALVIVIGFPRYLRDLKQVLDLSKEKKLPTIAITDSEFSALIGDINLYTPAETNTFISNHCAPMVLINKMVTELSLLDRQRTRLVLEKFEKLAESHKYFV